MEAREYRVVGDVPHEGGQSNCRRVGIDHEFTDTIATQGDFAVERGLDCGRLVGELPPRVALREEGCNVTTRPHPGRIPDLQVETPASEHRRELQLPVEEALLPRHPLTHP